jgi:hypothetical protein
MIPWSKGRAWRIGGAVLWLACGAAVAQAQGGRDSTAAPPDTAHRTGVPASPPAGAATPGAAPAPPPAAVLPPSVAEGPPDAVLDRACAGGPGGAQAPGLLAVLFRPATPDAAQAAAARAVGGTLAGLSPYGETYVLVPDSAGPLPDVADRLIRQDPVTTVSPVPCPAAASAAPAPVPQPAPAPAPAPGGGTASPAAPKDSAPPKPPGGSTRGP